MKLQINVTKEILIKSRFCGISINGQPAGDGPVALHCAIALAVRDLFPKAGVGYSGIGIPKQNAKEYGYLHTPSGLLPVYGEGEQHYIDLPEEATKFIMVFDNSTPAQRCDMKPFSFTVDVPEKLIEEIGIDDAISIIKRTPSLELVD